MSCSHGQELGQFTDLASDWLFTLVQPIRSPHYYLTQLLTMTTTHKFPSQVVEAVEVDFVAVDGRLGVGQLVEPGGYLSPVLQMRLSKRRLV